MCGRFKIAQECWILRNQLRKRVLIAGACAGALVWATWPAADQIKVESCSPNGLFATLSAAVHGKAFWRVQLADVARRRWTAENWDQNQADMRARVDDIVRQSEERLNSAKRPSSHAYDSAVTYRRRRDSFPLCFIRVRCEHMRDDACCREKWCNRAGLRNGKFEVRTGFGAASDQAAGRA